MSSFFLFLPPHFWVCLVRYQTSSFALSNLGRYSLYTMVIVCLLKQAFLTTPSQTCSLIWTHVIKASEQLSIRNVKVSKNVEFSNFKSLLQTSPCLPLPPPPPLPLAALHTKHLKITPTCHHCATLTPGYRDPCGKCGNLSNWLKDKDLKLSLNP